MIQQRFRNDYLGEFVVLSTTWVNGRKEQTREWIDNPIQNQHISNRAVAIGSRADKDIFNFSNLRKHKGGLLGKKKLQTYVVGDIWKDLVADFTVGLTSEELNDIIEHKYQEENIVYTSATNCIRNPGQFYLIPFDPKLDVLALPIYIAAFDGHQEIFLLGYNKEILSGTKNWESQVNYVFNAFNTTKFWLVGVESNMPTIWRDNKNVSTLTYSDFISYCDV